MKQRAIEEQSDRLVDSLRIGGSQAVQGKINSVLFFCFWIFLFYRAYTRTWTIMRSFRWRSTWISSTTRNKKSWSLFNKKEASYERSKFYSLCFLFWILLMFSFRLKPLQDNHLQQDFDNCLYPFFNLFIYIYIYLFIYYTFLVLHFCLCGYRECYCFYLIQRKKKR